MIIVIKFLFESTIIIEVNLMSEIEELLADINKLRENLHQLIERHGFDLNDAEVLEASKNLNTAIVNYNVFLKDKINLV